MPVTVGMPWLGTEANPETGRGPLAAPAGNRGVSAMVLVGSVMAAESLVRPPALCSTPSLLPVAELQGSFALLSPITWIGRLSGKSGSYT